MRVNFCNLGSIIRSSLWWYWGGHCWIKVGLLKSRVVLEHWWLGNAHKIEGKLL